MTAGNLIATEETFVPESRSLMNAPILTAMALCTSTNPTSIAAPLSQSQLWYSPIVSFLLCYQIKACPIYWDQTALNISVNKILAPYSCLDRTINLSCSTIALNISKTKVWEILGKQEPSKNQQDSAKTIIKIYTCISLPNFTCVVVLLISYCSMLFVCLFVYLFKSISPSPIISRQPDLCGLMTPQILSMDVKLCFGQFLHLF